MGSTHFDLDLAGTSTGCSLSLQGLRVVFEHPELGVLGELFPGFDVAKLRPAIDTGLSVGAFVTVATTDELVNALRMVADAAVARLTGGRAAR